MKLNVLTVAILIGSATLAAGKKHDKQLDLDWKKGTLLETTFSRETIGGGGPIAIANSSSGDGGNPALAAAGQAATAAAIAANQVRHRTWQAFTIQGDMYRFMVMCPVLVKHMPNVTVNGPIHYAMEKGKFYMLDDDGMYFEMTVLEKALPPAPVKQAP